jgi:hypothetical protein
VRYKRGVDASKTYNCGERKEGRGKAARLDFMKTVLGMPCLIVVGLRLKTAPTRLT